MPAAPPASAFVHVEHRGIGVVLRPTFDGVARPFHELTDADWDAAWEQPMRATILALGEHFRQGARRFVLVIPTTALHGGAQYSHVAAPAEALRLIVKSAARQWGTHGVTINALAVAPQDVLDDAIVAGASSIAPPAFGGTPADPNAVLDFLCSDASGQVTGQTITVDGGQWI